MMRMLHYNGQQNIYDRLTNSIEKRHFVAEIIKAKYCFYFIMQLSKL